MPSFKSAVLAMLVATVAALPPSVRLTPRQLNYHAIAKRQQENAQQSGLSDLDILQL